MFGYLDAASGGMIAAAAAGGLAGVRVLARNFLTSRRSRSEPGDAAVDAGDDDAATELDAAG